MTAPKIQKKLLLATIDLGAHSCRLLIAECNPRTLVSEVLDELSVFVPLGSDVFRHGVISDSSIRMLCDIFRNFRMKLKEYGVKNCRAIATSAVREAANAEILIERIRHATGFELKIFDGTDEARLNYLTVRNVLPRNFNFDKKSVLIADIGTGACQISAFEQGSFVFTETIKLGTLRVLDLLPGIVSADGMREYLTPIVDKTFNELRQIAPDMKSRCIIAMGTSVRTLLSLFRGNVSKNPGLVVVSRADYEARLAEARTLSFENLADQYQISPELAEMVIPCSIILDNLFRITNASKLLVPAVSTKQSVLQDFAGELLHHEDGFSRQIEELVRRTAKKYRADSDYTHRTALIADKLFAQLQGLHGCDPRNALLLRIAALLHKTGLFINNQSYHVHSAYIIQSTEIPGISPMERKITALIARFHRKNPPHPQDPLLAELPPDARSTVMKLTAILRIACILSELCRSANQFTLSVKPESVAVVPAMELRMSGFSLPEQDAAFFNQIFAVPVMVQ